MAETLADLLESRFGLETETGRSMAAEGDLGRILARRTHRRYRPDPVPAELMEVLLACGLSAGSKSDLQQASIVWVKDPARRAAIAGWIPSMPWIGSAPEFLLFCGDHRRLRRLAIERGRPFPNDNVDMFMNAAVDAALVMQTFTLAAEAAGLGCCAISEVRSHIDAVSELLELPRWVFPVAGLCVGYPSREGYVSMRLPPAMTVHVDRYRDDDLVEQLDAYDRRRDERFRIPAEAQRRTETFGVADFYGWSEDKARQCSVPQRGDFRRYLEGQGFALE